MEQDKRHSNCEYCGAYFDSHMMEGLTANDCQCQAVEIPNGMGNKERWLEIVKKTKKCRYCPPHGGCCGN